MNNQNSGFKRRVLDALAARHATAQSCHCSGEPLNVAFRQMLCARPDIARSLARIEARHRAGEIDRQWMLASGLRVLEYLG